MRALLNKWSRDSERRGTLIKSSLSRYGAARAHTHTWTLLRPVSEIAVPFEGALSRQRRRSLVNSRGAIVRPRQRRFSSPERRRGRCLQHASGTKNSAEKKRARCTKTVAKWKVSIFLEAEAAAAAASARRGSENKRRCDKGKGPPPGRSKDPAAKLLKLEIHRLRYPPRLCVSSFPRPSFFLFFLSFGCAFEAATVLRTTFKITGTVRERRPLWPAN